VHKDVLKYFGLNSLTIESEIRRIQREYEVDLGHSEDANHSDIDETYFPQFAEKLRREAAEMSAHYAVFYCLENSIRDLISKRLEEEFGADWWEVGVPPVVRENARKNKKKEDGSGITPRSSDLIDYSNFGELGEIIKTNWNIFGDMLRDIRAVERVLGNLNTLRAPIAHCKALAEIEVVRLELSLRDWFRQME
jgi:hypothetical protein